MASTSAGLATLSAKVATLESALNVIPQSNGFASVTLKNVIQSKEDKIKAELKKAEDVYLQGIEASNIDISTSESIEKNIFKLVKYSIKFIEVNGKQLANTLLTEISSNFKLSTCISLLLQIVGELFPHSYLIEYINDGVALINEFTKDDTSSITSSVSSGTLKKNKSKKLFCK